MVQNQTIQDIVKDIYVPDNYLSEDDISLIRNTFRGETGKRLIRLLRKVFIPTAGDPDLPIEELKSDAWLLDHDFEMIPSEEIKAIVGARARAIKMLFGGLIKLKIIANAKEETAEEKKNRMLKDSAR